MTNFEKVGLFMSIFGQEVKTKSELSNDKINSLRLNLIQEELDELEGREVVIRSWSIFVTKGESVSPNIRLE